MWEETGVSRDQQQSSLNYSRQHTQITDIMEARSFCSVACVGEEEEEAGKQIYALVWSYRTSFMGICGDYRECEVGREKSTSVEKQPVQMCVWHMQDS